MTSDRILIVEDDLAIRELVEAVIHRAGLLTTSVADGLDAIAAMKRETFCAVFLDLMMPRMNGYDVIGYIRENALSVPVVVLTAAVKSLQHDRLDPAVVKVVLTKPFDIENITGAIRTVCPPGASRTH